MNTVISISYKDDHTDTVKGCVMDRFSSEFEINSGPEDEVLAKLVKLELDLDVHDSSYDHYFVIEGCVIGYGELYTPFPVEEWDTQEELIERVKFGDTDLREKYHTMLEYEKGTRKEAERLRKDEEQRIKEQRQREADLRKLQELKEKYPDPDLTMLQKMVR